MVDWIFSKAIIFVYFPCLHISIFHEYRCCQTSDCFSPANMAFIKEIVSRGGDSKDPVEENYFSSTTLQKYQDHQEICSYTSTLGKANLIKISQKKIL